MVARARPASDACSMQLLLHSNGCVGLQVRGRQRPRNAAHGAQEWQTAQCCATSVGGQNTIQPTRGVLGPYASLNNILAHGCGIPASTLRQTPSGTGRATQRGLTLRVVGGRQGVDGGRTAGRAVPAAAGSELARVGGAWFPAEQSESQSEKHGPELAHVWSRKVGKHCRSLPEFALFFRLFAERDQSPPQKAEKYAPGAASCSFATCEDSILLTERRLYPCCVIFFPVGTRPSPYLATTQRYAAVDVATQSVPPACCNILQPPYHAAYRLPYRDSVTLADIKPTPYIVRCLLAAASIHSSRASGVPPPFRHIWKRIDQHTTPHLYRWTADARLLFLRLHIRTAGAPSHGPLGVD
ncbi:hypothetical protein HYPSUDRAFT_205057 [Hypholoma sublateritium FD-334 SS-4]|uniref:Uncharacterized protein n=1 Tax=Hypholoma sublateritium (strain FD-334 SS-4) TaxID=945553 RepID=A0A0D2M6M7_HYPSF|nr:hypothetical protein HYPSUDRAFT_205057 [Hypholoma sublateritium FD-334 SS-4]